MATGEPPWDLFDQEVEVYDHDAPDQGEYRGHEGVTRWLEDWGAAWLNGASSRTRLRGLPRGVQTQPRLSGSRRGVASGGTGGVEGSYEPGKNPVQTNCPPFKQVRPAGGAGRTVRTGGGGGCA
jgi:hypothetical protein